MLLVDVAAARLARLDLALAAQSAAGRTPEWVGWLVLGTLLLGFALLTWWLFFSPVPRPVRPAPVSSRVLGTRRLLAGLILLSGALITVGARWDEVWHRIYGGFGDDFLWPPHLLIYTSLGLNAAFAGLGLGTALRGRGGLRERFRSEPLMGLLGLLGLYGIFTVPSDALWHEIIGPDITAWSLPHALLATAITTTMVVGLAIARSTVARPAWSSILGRPSPMEAVALGLVAIGALTLLLIGGTEYEWSAGDGRAFAAVLQRPAWAYPVLVLLIGAALAHLALHATQRIGAATALALGVLGVQIVWVLITRAILPPGPSLVAHLLLVPPAVALDAWYARSRLRAGAASVQLAGAALYALVFFAVAFPYLAQVLPVPALDPAGRLETLAIGLPAALAVGLAFSRAGAWLGRIGQPEPGAPPRDARTAAQGGEHHAVGAPGSRLIGS